MRKSKSPLSPKLKVQKPVPVLHKPVKADFKDLFKALAKGVGHTATGKWVELGGDAVEALSALGLTTQPGELGFLLIRRSLTMAVFELVGDSASQFSETAAADADPLVDTLDLSIEAEDMSIDQKFLDRPGDLPIVESFKRLLSGWLKGLRIEESAADAIAGRLPSYFVYALNQEWRRNSEEYISLRRALRTPFAKADDREWAWAQYAALLERRIQEPVFDEPFSLSQIFVPLSAFYFKERPRNELEAEALRDEKQKHRRVVIALQEELASWVDGADPQDAIRVISGGLGSGKSSFARVFAASIAQTSKIHVLFVPLHLIDASKDLVEEVGRFVRDEGVLLGNPLNPQSPDPNLLIIFDGLNELASQGKAAAATARGFVREVEKTVERRNQQAFRLRVLLSGRELVVQENESEFRRPRQILNLLPYFTPLSAEYENDVVTVDGIEHEDPTKLLQRDARQEWWKNYGMLTGKNFDGLPKELDRKDLAEITAQPLLNYLVALSFTRDKLDFNQDINLNSIYADLVTAVYERGYEKHRAYGPIRHMTLDHFWRVLEEIGLAAWHGDGRTTTVREIEEHFKTSGVGAMLDAFKEGAEAGVTRLLAAFFFRQYGQRTSGDATFVFTHKSFGEYLAARRVVRAMERVSKELERRASSPDEGWDELDALKHWAQICGPSAISEYLHTFLINEVRLRSSEERERWEVLFTRLFNFVLRHGMPMEQLPIASFREAMFQSHNAETSLLIALNVSAQTNKRLLDIEQPDSATFRTWRKRTDGESVRSSIVRSIEFPPEYYQSGVTILGYFASVLRQKNLSENVKVAIEQDGLVVRLVIEAPTGQRELIEQTLETYALVVTGQSPVEEFMTSSRGEIELRSQLSIALAQLQTSRDLLRYVDEDRSALRAQLSDSHQALEKIQRRSDSDTERFMAMLSTLISNNSELAGTLQRLAEQAMSGNNLALSEALNGLKAMIERGVNEEDKAEFIQKVQIIKSENPTLFNKITEVLLGSVSGAGGSLLYDWIKIVIGSLPR